MRTKIYQIFEDSEEQHRQFLANQRHHLKEKRYLVFFSSLGFQYKLSGISYFFLLLRGTVTENRVPHASSYCYGACSPQTGMSPAAMSERTHIIFTFIFTYNFGLCPYPALHRLAITILLCLNMYFLTNIINTT